MGDIAALEAILAKQFGLSAVIGAELECYVDVASDEMDGFWKPIHDWMQLEGIAFKRIEKERGDTQFEIVFEPGSAASVVKHLRAVRARISNAANDSGLSAFFDGKPKPDQPSSGLHLHIHMQNEEGHDVFFKTQDETSEALEGSIAGLLGTIPLAMRIWCPEEADLNRFLDEDHVPRTLSWGMNNRYAALRIPATINPFKVLEHRMCSPNANPEGAIAAMLAGVITGLEHELPLPEQEFGKPAHRHPSEWVSFLVPAAQERFLGLLGKTRDELRHG